mmetsp:Transcript_45174/g.105743  ORF Transcript_45174/g.105743 Transcript_45174/m.105743 type:complete len:262 (+) Transcript_45174:1671-2456(+)
MTASDVRSLSVIVPAYNEETRLVSMLREAVGYLARRSSLEPVFTWELLVVDDGSADRTFDVARRFAAELAPGQMRVLRLPRNRGKGAAVREGMLAANGRLMLMADADGATRFSDIERLEQHFLQHPARDDALLLVAGSRAHLHASALLKRKWYRNLLTHAFHFLVALALGGASLKDTQCGFKLFGRAAAVRLFTNLHVSRWAFDVELLFIASRLAIEVREEPVTWTEIPGSKMRLSGIMQMAKELLLIRLMHATGWWRIVQ